MIAINTDDPKCWRSLRETNRMFRKVLSKDPCAYCSRPQPRKKSTQRDLPLLQQPTVDHIVPKSTLIRGEGPLNWTGSCWGCNHLKKDIPLLLFLLEENRPKAQEIHV